MDVNNPISIKRTFDKFHNNLIDAIKNVCSVELPADVVKNIFRNTLTLQDKKNIDQLNKLGLVSISWNKSALELKWDFININKYCINNVFNFKDYDNCCKFLEAEGENLKYLNLDCTNTNIKEYLNFDCTNTNIKGLINILQNCPNLQSLNLSLPNIISNINTDIDISTEDLKELVQCCLTKNPKLESLDISNVRIHVSSLKELNPLLKKLKSFNLNHQQHVSFELVDIIEEMLKDCKQLESLNLNNNLLRNRDIKKIVQCCPNLKFLELSDNNVSDDGLKELEKLGKNLVSLNLHENQMITSIDLINLLQKCPNIKYLDLSNIYFEDGEVIQHILKLCPNLESLNLKDNLYITNAAFLQSDQFPPNLKDLNLWNVNLTDEGLLHIAKNCPNLQSLHITGPYTGIGLNAVLAHCPKLVSLGLEFWDLITGTNLGEVSKLCPDLQSLSLDYKIADTSFFEYFSELKSNNFKQATSQEDSIILLTKYCSNLQSLTLFDSNIEIDKISEILFLLPNLRSLTLNDSNLKEDDHRNLSTFFPDLNVKFNQTCTAVAQ